MYPQTFKKQLSHAHLNAGAEWRSHLHTAWSARVELQLCLLHSKLVRTVAVDGNGGNCWPLRETPMGCVPGVSGESPSGVREMRALRSLVRLAGSSKSCPSSPAPLIRTVGARLSACTRRVGKSGASAALKVLLIGIPVSQAAAAADECVAHAPFRWTVPTSHHMYGPKEGAT